GFLPGTLSEKIDPYLRPLYDALHDMLDPDSIPRLMASGTIEVAPLGYMRGRTLNDSFIVLDEAQNTSPEQMKMFLTRLGFGAKMVVTVDVDERSLERLARHVLDQMRVHPLVELSIRLVDVPAMTSLHEHFMDEPGPTDVLAFPMDELHDQRVDENDDDAPPTLLGDVVL